MEKFRFLYTAYSKWTIQENPEHTVYALDMLYEGDGVRCVLAQVGEGPEFKLGEEILCKKHNDRHTIVRIDKHRYENEGDWVHITQEFR